MTTFAIQTKALGVSYGTREALGDLSLEIPQGEVFGGKAVPQTPAAVMTKSVAKPATSPMRMPR